MVIKADSADDMAGIHDRRPVALMPDLAREWLAPATPKERAEVFEWFKVDSAVGNVRNKGAALIQPISTQKH